jgi:hypothetical protein
VFLASAFFLRKNVFRGKKKSRCYKKKKMSNQTPQIVPTKEKVQPCDDGGDKPCEKVQPAEKKLKKDVPVCCDCGGYCMEGDVFE